jgi:endonuclease/exonuclease/phosphatase family metal-dependent hydrolase
MISNQHRISIATLNCRGLKKTTDLNKRKKFIRYLLTLQYDVLVLQETHADNPDIIAQFNMQFKTHNRPNSSHWTPHCAIIILNNKYSLQLLQDGIDNGRFILANIQLTSTVPSENDSTSNSPTTIATILGIYGRSSIHPERSAFYSTLLDIPIVHRTLHNPQSPVLIMGDFNYSYENHRRPDGTLTSAPPEWLSLLDNFYVDCFQDQKQITWKTNTSSSILDFIFCSTPTIIKLAMLSSDFFRPNGPIMPCSASLSSTPIRTAEGQAPGKQIPFSRLAEITDLPWRHICARTWTHSTTYNPSPHPSNPGIGSKLKSKFLQNPIN